MMSPRRTRAVDPDRHYQLPHPDLVSIPPALLEHTRVDLLSYIDLWERLGAAAEVLARDLRELESAGGCPDDLAAALLEAIQLWRGSTIARGRARAHIDDDDVSISTDPQTSSSNGGFLGGCAEISSKGDLVDRLHSLGFLDPRAFIDNHGQERVKAALLYALSKPPKSITNLTGFIVRLVEKPGKIPRPVSGKGPPDPDRYVRGRYGHMVKR